MDRTSGGIVFGAEVRARRRRLGLSQEELARRAGVDVRTVRRIEQDQTLPRPTTLRQLGDALALDGAARADFYAAAFESTARRPAAVPAELPADVPAFAGRGGEVTHLDALLQSNNATGIVLALCGTAGWARRSPTRWAGGT
jgi:transcriptional regulator with XRE-family HTH domain